MTPISAKDFSRRKWQIAWIAAAVLLTLLAGTGFIYRRYIDPLHAKESFDAGTRLFKIGRYNEATLSFDRAIALQSDFTDAYLLRGKAYVEQADPERAVRDFAKVTELRPSDPAGWIARGEADLELNNFRAAATDASQAIALDPKLAASYALRGSALRKGGDAKKAIEDFKAAVSLDPSARHYFERGTTYQLIGEHQLAIADFNQVIEMIPDYPSAFFARAESRLAVGDVAGAREDRETGRNFDRN